jgi:uncharacterized iron-regulated membrane protein
MAKKFSLRSLLFWPHLVVGLVTGIMVFVLSLTGALLAFERPIVAASDAHTLGGLDPLPARLPMSQLIASVEQTAGQKVSSITVPADARAAVAMEAGRERVYLVDPYRGTVVGPASAGWRNFFQTVTGLHRWFGLSAASHKTAMLVKGWFTLGFVFLILSGWLLWLPARWTPQALRMRLRPGWAQTARAREYNWHHAFGLWCSVPLLAVAVTGVIMALPWANQMLFRVTGSPLPEPRGHDGKPQAKRGGGEARGAAAEHGKPEHAALDYDQMLATARTEAAAHLNPKWHTLSIRIPEADAHTVQVMVDAGNGAQPQKRDTLVFKANGQLDHTERFSAQSLGKRARAIVRFLHTGEVYGGVGEAIGFLACVAGMLLCYTGIALAVRRFAR